jgi:Fe-S cluster assembly protein SufD
MIHLHSLETLKEQLKVEEYPIEFIENPVFTSGINSISQTGLPNPKNEEWKYFPLTSLINAEYALPGKSTATIDPKAYQPYLSNAIHIVMINGKYVHDQKHNEVKGLQVSTEHLPIASIVVDPKDNPFPLLNALLHSEKVTINIGTTFDPSLPIHILHVFDQVGDTPIIASPSISLHIDKDAKATVIESYHVNGAQNGLINTTFSVHADTFSELHHVIIEDGLGSCVLIYNGESTLKKSAKVQDHVIVHDSLSVRNTISGKLTAEDGLYNVYGVVSANSKAIIDNHTVVDHIAPNCESNELFKHVLDDASTAVFNGKIFVRLDAQKTNAYQSNRTLLLSPRATINTKPQLEIFADDVKCSHGATTGSVDEESLYYLQARGIPKEKAKKLLTEAFIGEVIQLIDNDELREYYTGDVLLNAGE